MPLTKPNQGLYEDLDGHAATIDWLAIELIDIAKRINEAGLPSDAMALKALRTQIGKIIGMATVSDSRAEYEKYIAEKSTASRA